MQQMPGRNAYLDGLLGRLAYSGLQKGREARQEAAGCVRRQLSLRWRCRRFRSACPHCHAHIAPWRTGGFAHAQCATGHRLASSSGSLAMLAAIRRASSRVSSLAGIFAMMRRAPGPRDSPGVSSLFGVTTLRTLPPDGRKPRQSRRLRWPRPSRRRPSPCLALLSHNPRQRVSSDIVLL